MTIANAGTGKFANANGFSLTPGGTGHFILLSVICTTTASWATAITNSGNVTWKIADIFQAFGKRRLVRRTHFLFGHRRRQDGQEQSASRQHENILHRCKPILLPETRIVAKLRAEVTTLLQAALAPAHNNESTRQ